MKTLKLLEFTYFDRTARGDPWSVQVVTKINTGASNLNLVNAAVERGISYSLHPAALRVSSEVEVTLYLRQGFEIWGRIWNL